MLCLEVCHPTSKYIHPTPHSNPHQTHVKINKISKRCVNKRFIRFLCLLPYLLLFYLSLCKGRCWISVLVSFAKCSRLTRFCVFHIILIDFFVFAQRRELDVMDVIEGLRRLFQCITQHFLRGCAEASRASWEPLRMAVCVSPLPHNPSLGAPSLGLAGAAAWRFRHHQSDGPKKTLSRFLERVGGEERRGE